MVLVLSTTFVLGLGLQALRERVTPPRPRFEYGELDSVFTARSGQTTDTSSGGGFSPPRHPSHPPLHSIPLNTADAATLTRVPGIGPVFAARILTYRKERGPFTTIDDLRRVKGIGPKKLAHLRPYLTLQ